MEAVNGRRSSGRASAERPKLRGQDLVNPEWHAHSQPGGRAFLELSKYTARRLASVRGERVLVRRGPGQEAHCRCRCLGHAGRRDDGVWSPVLFPVSVPAVGQLSCWAACLLCGDPGSRAPWN